MAGQKYYRNLKEVNVSELKPGNVLSENINICGLTRGHVLSLLDINKIIQHNIHKTQVFLLESEYTEEDDGSGISVNDIYRKELKDEISKKEMTGQQKITSISDITQCGNLQEIVELKKEWIRGENYLEKINEKQQKQKDKFSKALKKSSIQFIEESMKVINEFSISSSDLEGLEQIGSITALDLAKKMETYETNAEIFLNAVINDQTVYSSFVEDIIADLMGDIGYRLSIGLLARIIQEDHFRDFLSYHSLQVVIISLITAIEMTKMVQGKTEILKENEFDTFLSLSKKFFSLEDLINVGISAFLHDISLKKYVPNMNPGFKFGVTNQRINELHPSEGFHLSKKLNIDFEVQNAVFQHNERFDGSGRPNGTLPHLFSKYTPVLMFAEHFIESTTKNPFVEKPLNPREFLMNLLSNERIKFDGDVIYAFIRAASMYPVGSWVFLRDEKIGLVADVNKSSLDKPVVIVFLDEKLNRIKPYKVDLYKDSVTIINPINFSSIRERFNDPKNDIWPYLSDNALTSL